MTFSTGFQSNLGIISAIVGMGDYVILDRENHASIYDACRLSYGKMLRFRHADMADLEKKLQEVPCFSGRLYGCQCGDRGLCEARFPSLYFLCFHSAVCLRRGAGLSAVHEKPSGDRPEALRQQRLLPQGSEGSRPADHGNPDPGDPYYTYEAFNTLEKTRKAYDAGVYCNPVLPPACAPNECLIRTSLMATHTDPLLDEAVEVLAEVMKDEA